MAVPVVLKHAVTAIEPFLVWWFARALVEKGALEGYRPGRGGWTSDMVVEPYLDPCQRQSKANRSNVTENAGSLTKARRRASDAVMYVVGVGFFRSGCEGWAREVCVCVLRLASCVFRL